MSPFGLACTLAVAGCSGQSAAPPGATTSPFATHATAVGPSVAPRAPRLPYRAFGKELTDPAVRAIPEATLAFEVAREPAREGRQPSTQLRRAGSTGRAMAMADDGTLDTGGEFPGAISELVESLPPPGTQLEVGVTYDAGAPDPAYLARAFDEGSAVIWQITRNTPLAIYADGDRKLVALDVVGENRGYARDGAGVRESAMGPAFRTRTDLAYTPETGWVVLRLRRVTQSSAVGDSAAIAFADLLAAPHSEFNACLDLPVKLDGLAAATDADFPACP